MSNRYYKGYRGRFRGKKRPRNVDPVSNPSNQNNNSNSDNSGNESDSTNNIQVNSINQDHNTDLFKNCRDLDIPYVGWNLYFHNKEYTKNSLLVKKVQIMESFMKRHIDLLTQANLQRFASLSIDMQRLNEDTDLLKEWPNFIDDLQNDPITTLNCFSLAVHQTIINVYSENGKKHTSDDINRTIRIKLFNYSSVTSLKELKISYYGKLVSTKGCIIRVGRCKQIAQWIVFSCVSCKLQKLEKQPDGIYTLPKKCEVCGAKKFVPLWDSPYVKTVPFQIVKLQEHFGDDQEDRGRVPRILNVELIDDLVNTCMPGNDVTITGIIKMQKSENTKAKAQISNPFSLYMEAVSVTNNKSSSENTILNEELKHQDLLAIKVVHNDSDIFSLLVRSLCPTIYGHEIIKAGLLLCLFGGSPKHDTLRDDIHVMLIGDPGLGKSQMLRACARVAPKGVFLSGNLSTTSGLTVALQRDPGTNDYELEPGALVLADKGVCCIDEFDKMPTQHQALLEAMEQQRVSVAKSSVLWSLPARTSIIAAANPIGGRYDNSKTISENINMSQPLLSRFDLVFLLLDKPSKHLDNYLVNCVMNMHTGARNVRSNTQKEQTSSQTNESSSQHLQFRLRETLDAHVISHSLMRKYIAYARQYVKPKLSKAAAALLQAFYLELRRTSKSVPIYTRQLEALIRLTEARAKVDLRENATIDDAKDVIDLMEHTIMDTTEHVSLRISASQGGKKQKNKLESFLYLLNQECMRQNKKHFTATELYDLAAENQIVIKDISTFISRLNENGYLLKKGSDCYEYRGIKRV